MGYSCIRLTRQAQLCQHHTRGCVASGGSTSYAAGSPSSPSTMISIALLRACSQEFRECSRHSQAAAACEHKELLVLEHQATFESL